MGNCCVPKYDFEFDANSITPTLAAKSNRTILKLVGSKSDIEVRGLKTSHDLDQPVPEKFKCCNCKDSYELYQMHSLGDGTTMCVFCYSLIFQIY